MYFELYPRGQDLSHVKEIFWLDRGENFHM